MTLISELLDLPDQVQRGRLRPQPVRGRHRRPPATLARVRRHAAAGRLLRRRPRASSAPRSRRRTSKACYLHGSFGAGKSHFMAVLHLLLQHDPSARASARAWRRSAPSTSWVEGKKFLLVPYHMIGARNMESAILGGYVDHVRRVHPDAPLPGRLPGRRTSSTNADSTAQTLGDEKFFAQLNQGGRAAGGELGQARRGLGRRPVRGRAGGPARRRDARPAGRRPRQHLFPRLPGHPARGKDEAFCRSTRASASSAATPGRWATTRLILFLDELILWLATHVGRPRLRPPGGAEAGQAGRGRRRPTGRSRSSASSPASGTCAT